MKQRVFSTNVYSPEAVARNETLFTTANGNFGLRGDFEEKKGCRHKGTYINGFFDSEPIVYGESAYGYAQNHQTILNLPDPKRIEFSVNGNPFSLNEGTVQSFVQSLDFVRGVMSRRVEWQAPDGSEVRVDAARIVPFAYSSGAAIEFCVTALNKPVRIGLQSSIDTTVHNLGAEDDPRVGSKFSSRPLIIEDLTSANGSIRFTASTRNSGLALAGVALHDCSVRGSETASLLSGESRTAGGIGTVSWECVLDSGESILLRKYISYESGVKKDLANEGGIRTLAERAGKTAETLCSSGFDVLVAEQEQFLESFWNIASICVEGDDECEMALHFNLFHLLQSAGRNGTTSIAAKGLTAEGYEGHYFWDTEAYVCPVFTYLEPEIAGKLLEYRYSILPAARRRAEVMSLKGALYPWRTIDGEETSAYYPAGTAQYHIDADIMLALRKYMTAAGDAAFDSSCALEMGIETARMWMSLGSFIPSKGNKFCINMVTGPDEYTACVNNNAYTNFMARENLLFSIALVERFGRSVHGVAPVTDEELARWNHAVREMYIPFDKNRGLYPQDDSFFDKPVWDFSGTPKEMYPLLLHYHPLVIYRHQVLKQPDLVLAQLLLPDAFTLAEKKRNFLYYEKLTTGDSSLSHCIQSIMACETGDAEKGLAYFEKTARMDIADMHGNTCDGIHTAAMAGSWMSIVYGFAGFRDYGGKWKFNPCLPKKWESLSFSLLIEGCILDVSVRQDSVRYALRSGNKLSVWHRNSEFVLHSGDAKVFSLKRELRAVLFDLDGVITDTAELHYRAWKHVSDLAGLRFDRSINERLRGVSRAESLEIILAINAKKLAPDEKQRIIDTKNAHYVDLLAGLSEKDILPGIREVLVALRNKGIKTVLASASRNAGTVCERLGIVDLFDGIANIDVVQMSKPEPDIFLEAARIAGVWHTDCIGVEDAQAGLEAIRAAGMKSVGIGTSLSGADCTISSTAELTFELLERLMN